ncbi:hypothetical protein LTR40_007662 [Exophiala xenobiotica]|nr:hypothetical protein LTS06_011694 [Exophiala xenobiotica]KAK5258562.1 hypothetical protein LTR40_007662 [Exophiala xenobiotica]
MQSVRSSIPEDDGQSMTFNSAGGSQTNNVNNGSGQQIYNNAAVETQNFGSRMNISGLSNLHLLEHIFSFCGLTYFIICHQIKLFIFYDIVIRQKADLSFRNPVGLCLGQAPHIDPTLFIGRESEMAQMREILRPVDSSSQQRRLVLGGTGGMGKTQLAIAFTERHRQEYDSVFWLNAASEATLKDSFRLVTEAIFDRWLSDKKNTRWLLILDNYDDPSQYHIEQYYPYVSHGAIIVSTRRPDLVAGSEIRLQPLPTVKESLEILETRSRRQNVKLDVHVQRLAERLAGLPLALATAGAYLRHSTLTFERYLEEYERRWNIDPRRPLQLQEYQNRTLYTTWDISYSRLGSNDPDAARFLKLLAYFDTQSLWYGLFLGGLTDDAPVWMQEVIAHEVEFEGIMRTLTDYCFLEVRTPLQSWSMHTCVHGWTLSALNQAIDVQQYWYAFDCVAEFIDKDDWDFLGHLNYTRLAAHATWLVQERFRKSDLKHGIVSDRLDKAFYIAELLTKQVQLTAAEQMYLLALAGYEKALGVDHTSTLDTVHNLGNLYLDQAKLEEAEKMYQRALAGKEKALGADHTSTLLTVNNLGRLYAAQGKLEEAEKMYRRALAGCEKALGVDHTSTLDTVYRLGKLYRARDKLEEAEKMYMRALAGYENALGVEHTSTLDTVSNL